MFSFSIFGFPVTVQFWFWVTCILLGGGLRPGAFSSASSIAEMGIITILVFFSILVHELGHATTGRRYGANPEIILHGFGGAAVMHGSRFNRREDLLVTAAGPAASILLGTLALAALMFLPIPRGDVWDALRILVVINYFWTFINLLPIQPLDGGLLLRTALGDRRYHITCTVGVIFAVGAALLALLTHNIFLTLLMAMLAYENWRMRSH